MAEWINFLNSISPYVFAFGAFIYTISFLFKLLREERKKNGQAIEDIKNSMGELNKKMIHVMLEVDKALKNIRKDKML